MKKIKTAVVLAMLVAASAFAREHHVSIQGNDTNDGSARRPFRSIMAAAGTAKPGDVITVHEGVYREQINPPRGGVSDRDRIVYQAAEGEKVVIKGSEIVRGWEKVQYDTWKVILPNSFFGDFNPYNDVIHGDWFIAKDRDHHTGAVYLNGHWLVEAPKLEAVLEPAADTSFWFAQVELEYTTEGETVSLSLMLNPSVHDLCTRNGLIDETDMQPNIVTTKMLGRAMIPDLPFLNSDGAELRLDRDYFGQRRSETNPSAGPFEKLSDSKLTVKVWQKSKTVD